MNKTNEDTDYNIMINNEKIYDKISKHSIITYVYKEGK